MSTYGVGGLHKMASGASSSLAHVCALMDIEKANVE